MRLRLHVPVQVQHNDATDTHAYQLQWFVRTPLVTPGKAPDDHEPTYINLKQPLCQILGKSTWLCVNVCVCMYACVPQGVSGCVSAARAPLRLQLSILSSPREMIISKSACMRWFILYKPLSYLSVLSPSNGTAIKSLMCLNRLIGAWLNLLVCILIRLFVFRFLHLRLNPPGYVVYWPLPEHRSFKSSERIPCMTHTALIFCVVCVVCVVGVGCVMYTMCAAHVGCSVCVVSMSCVAVAINTYLIERRTSSLCTLWFLRYQAILGVHHISSNLLRTCSKHIQHVIMQAMRTRYWWFCCDLRLKPNVGSVNNGFQIEIQRGCVSKRCRILPAGNYIFPWFRAPGMLVEYALRLIQTCGNELCSALGGWLKSASFVCVAGSAV